MTNIKSQGSHCSSVLSQQKQTCNSELVHWFLFGDCKNYLCCPFLKQGMLSKFRFSETFTKFGKISDLVLTFSQTMLHSQNTYRTRAIISRGLYFFYPIFTLAAAYIKLRKIPNFELQFKSESNVSSHLLDFRKWTFKKSACLMGNLF